MHTKNIPPKPLTSTNRYRTFVHVRHKPMDQTSKLLLSKLRELRLNRNKIDQDILAIEKSLEFAKVRVSGETQNLREEVYEQMKPFETRSLAESCEMILEDHKPQWL